VEWYHKAVKSAVPEGLQADGFGNACGAIMIEEPAKMPLHGDYLAGLRGLHKSQ
jgi:hypothetical protein